MESFGEDFLDEKKSRRKSEEAKERQARRNTNRAKATAIVLLSQHEDGMTLKALRDMPVPKDIDPNDWKNALESLEEDEELKARERRNKNHPKEEEGEPSSSTKEVWDIDLDDDDFQGYVPSIFSQSSFTPCKTASDAPVVDVDAYLNGYKSAKSPRPRTMSSEKTDTYSSSVNSAYNRKDFQAKNTLKVVEGHCNYENAKLKEKLMSPKQSEGDVASACSASPIKSKRERVLEMLGAKPQDDSVRGKAASSIELTETSSKSKMARVLKMLSYDIPEKNLKTTTTSDTYLCFDKTAEDRKARVDEMLAPKATIKATWDKEGGFEEAYAREKAKVMAQGTANEDKNAKVKDILELRTVRKAPWDEEGGFEKAYAREKAKVMAEAMIMEHSTFASSLAESSAQQNLDSAAKEEVKIAEDESDWSLEQAIDMLLTVDVSTTVEKRAKAPSTAERPVSPNGQPRSSVHKDGHLGNPRSSLKQRDVDIKTSGKTVPIQSSADARSAKDNENDTLSHSSDSVTKLLEEIDSCENHASADRKLDRKSTGIIKRQNRESNEKKPVAFDQQATDTAETDELTVDDLVKMYKASLIDIPDQTHKSAGDECKLSVSERSLGEEKRLTAKDPALGNHRDQVGLSSPDKARVKFTGDTCENRMTNDTKEDKAVHTNATEIIVPSRHHRPAMYAEEMDDVPGQHGHDTNMVNGDNPYDERRYHYTNMVRGQHAYHERWRYATNTAPRQSSYGKPHHRDARDTKTYRDTKVYSRQPANEQGQTDKLLRTTSRRDDDGFFSCVIDEPRASHQDPMETKAIRRARLWVRKKYMVEEQPDAVEEARIWQSSKMRQEQNGHRHRYRRRSKSRGPVADKRHRDTCHSELEHRRRSKSRGSVMNERYSDSRQDQREHRRRSKSRGSVGDEGFRGSRHDQHIHRRRSRSRGPVVDKGPRDLFHDYHEQRRMRRLSVDERHRLRSDQKEGTHRRPHHEKTKTTGHDDQTVETKKKKSRATIKSKTKEKSSSGSRDTDQQSVRKQGGITALSKLRSGLRSLASGLRSVFTCAACTRPQQVDM